MNLYYKKFLKWIDPEIVFTNVFAQQEYAFWLDSSKVEEGLSRFSFMGQTKKHLSYSISSQTVTITDQGKTNEEKISIFDYLKERLGRGDLPAGGFSPVNKTDLPFDFVGGYVGYFGYEMQAECGSQQFHQSEFPDASFFFVDKFIAFDHKEKELYLVCRSASEKEAEGWFRDIQLRMQNEELAIQEEKKKFVGVTPMVAQKRNKPQYIQDIKTCQNHLRNGECYQICLTNQIILGAKDFSPVRDWFEIYKNLRRINPAPYSAYMRFGNFAILSSSPEMFLKIDSERTVISKPIKGTMKRGKTKEEDALLSHELKKTKKYFSENVMIVDLVRNDLGRVCELGSVEVKKFLDVETYATMHQLVSTITGKLRGDVSSIDAIKASFPGGSMTGAPKLKAMEVIASLEKEARGMYAGALGFLSVNGTTELSMVIRTMIATENKLQFGAGGAILVESDPEGEYQEMLLKTKSLVKAIKLRGK